VCGIIYVDILLTAFTFFNIAFAFVQLHYKSHVMEIKLPFRATNDDNVIKRFNFTK